MKPFRLFVVLGAAALAACSTANRAGELRSASVETTQSALADALGMPQDRPGRVMVDEGDNTVPTPYGGEGARRVCSTTARDIARLTAVLGAEVIYVPEQRENETAEERSWRERSVMWAGRSGSAVSQGARDLYHSAIVGLNPARPVLRFVGRAGEIEREARVQRTTALNRRAYLRGLFDGFGCGESYLTRAFDEYGLSDPVD
ncbi:hypothetical protein [Hyphobacterium sp.]|uniref:hypothetical protein n=1 Tax=Hyphobacterium sp. TaxID=2004662 RepID=UPI003B526B56